VKGLTTSKWEVADDGSYRYGADEIGLCCFAAPLSRSYSEYRRDVLIDLRAAKEEAEAERKRILQQIGRTLHRRWN
jgi:hypothetical protein